MFKAMIIHRAFLGFWVLTLILSVFMTAQGQEVGKGVRGNVVDDLGNPIHGVVVELVELELHDITDKAGVFNFSIPSEMHAYHLQFNHCDFKSESRYLNEEFESMEWMKEIKMDKLKRTESVLYSNEIYLSFSSLEYSIYENNLLHDESNKFFLALVNRHIQKYPTKDNIKMYSLILKSDSLTHGFINYIDRLRVELYELTDVPEGSPKSGAKNMMDTIAPKKLFFKTSSGKGRGAVLEKIIIQTKLEYEKLVANDPSAPPIFQMKIVDDWIAYGSGSWLGHNIGNRPVAAILPWLRTLESMAHFTNRAIIKYFFEKMTGEF